MSPEGENIFEMPPHLFWGSCPFWAKLRMADQQFLFFLQLEQVILGVIGGDKANPIGSGSPQHSAGGTSSLCLTARP